MAATGLKKLLRICALLQVASKVLLVNLTPGIKGKCESDLKVLVGS